MLGKLTKASHLAGLFGNATDLVFLRNKDVKHNKIKVFEERKNKNQQVSLFGNGQNRALKWL